MASRVPLPATKIPAALLTLRPAGSTLHDMEPDEILPRRAGDPVDALARFDLDPLSVEELEARIALFEAEIARTRRHLDRAVNHRASADALFKR